MTPKSLLRAEVSRSSIEDLTSGGFRVVVDDPATGSGPPIGDHQLAAFSIDPAEVERVVLCSGKVAFDAMRWREKYGASSRLTSPIPVVRVEQLYPWPEVALGEVLDRYPAATELVWLQDEPENMGAWPFAHNRLHRLVRDRYTLRHVSRPESASPATGSAALHNLEHEDLMVRALG
jgi:multifunctional 2-oxoglutarate metabolism enzyme